MSDEQPRAGFGRFPVGIAGQDLHFEEHLLAQGDPPPWPPNAELAVVGKPAARPDARQKVTGAARFTCDVQRRGMLHARRIVSSIPHGRIVSIDTSRAERVPGVRAIHLLERGHDGEQLAEGIGQQLPDPVGDPPSRWPMVRYVGQALGAIAAITQKAADEAVSLVEIEYEPLPFVVDPEAAAAPDAPRVYPGDVKLAFWSPLGGTTRQVQLQGNRYRPPRVARGDVERGFAEADVVVEGTFTTQVQTHCCMETHGVVASWDAGKLEVHASTQALMGFRATLAAMVDALPEDVRVLAEHVGGGFGSKLTAGSYALLAAELSRKAERPVRLVLDRAEEHLCTGNRPASRQRLRIGAKRDGTLTAIRLDSSGSAGIAIGAGVGRAAGWMYACPSFESEHLDIFVNAGPGSPFRAPAEPAGVFALEQLVDELAEKLGMDPLDLRDRIDTRTEAACRQHRVERELGAERIGWSRRHAPGADPGPVKRGMGMAQALWPRRVVFPASCEVAISREGRVEIRSGAQDPGTGTRAVLAQVVAEELGLRPEDVVVRIGDSDFPPAPRSAGSTLTGSLTPAARGAACQAGRRLLEVAGKRLRLDPGDLAFRGRSVVSHTQPGRSLGFVEAAALLGRAGAVGRAQLRGDQTSVGDLGGVQFAEVAVDMDTGIVTVERVVAVQDCGRPINLLGLQNQVNGGVLHGISWALHEDRVLDPGSGRMLNADLETYKIVGACETPAIEVHFIEEYRARSSTDASGIAEPSNVATAAAIANAVYNAIGVRVRDLPMTPPLVLAALGAGRSG